MSRGRPVSTRSTSGGLVGATRSRLPADGPTGTEGCRGETRSGRRTISKHRSGKTPGFKSLTRTCSSDMGGGTTPSVGKVYTVLGAPFRTVDTGDGETSGDNREEGEGGKEKRGAQEWHLEGKRQGSVCERVLYRKDKDDIDPPTPMSPPTFLPLSHVEEVVGVSVREPVVSSVPVPRGSGWTVKCLSPSLYRCQCADTAHRVEVAGPSGEGPRVWRSRRDVGRRREVVEEKPRRGLGLKTEGVLRVLTHWGKASGWDPSPHTQCAYTCLPSQREKVRYEGDEGLSREGEGFLKQLWVSGGRTQGRGRCEGKGLHDQRVSGSGPTSTGVSLVRRRRRDEEGSNNNWG